MNEFLTAFQAVFPPTLLIVIGFIARRCGLVNAQETVSINRFCFYLFVSVLVFKNIYEAQISAGECGPLVAFCVIGIVLELVLGAVVVRRIEPNPPSQASMIQAMFRTNVVIMGLPLANSLFPNAGLIGVVYAVVVPLFNVLAVILFEVYRGGRINPKNLAVSILKNPLIIASITALLLKFFRLSLPGPVEGVIAQMSTTGSCLVLVTLGASLELSKLRGNRGRLAFCLSARLVVLPLIALAIAVALGFRGLSLFAVLIVFGCPLASTTYTVARQMGGDGELAAEVLVASTVLSCFTLFLWIYLLKLLALI